MASTLSAAVRGLFGPQQFQRVQRHGHVAGEDLEKLQVAFAEGPRLGAFDVERADHLVVQDQRHGQRALGSLAPFEIQRIVGRVFAQIALAGGGHETGDAVVLRLGKQVAAGGFRNDAHGQQRLELAGAAVQQADLDDVEMQQVLGEVQDVRLQQLDALLDRHHRQFVGHQVGQFHAGLVDGGQLLLLQHLRRHVAHRDDQVLRRRLVLENRGGVHLEVAVVARAQRRVAGAAGGQRRVERTEVGPEDLGAAQHGVKIRADDAVALGPLAQPAVAPDDRVLGIEHDDAVGHAFQDALVLQQLADLKRVTEMFRTHVEPGERLASQPAQSPQRALDLHHLE